MTVIRPTGVGQAQSLGVPVDNLVAYIDIGDLNSYSGSGTTVTDFQSNLSNGTIAGATFTNGALEFDGAAASGGDLTFTQNATTNNIFAGGGTIMVFVRIAGSGGNGAGQLVNTGYATFTDPGYTLFTENELSGGGGSVRITFTRGFSSIDGTWDFLGEDDVNFRVCPLDDWVSIAIVYDDSSVANAPRMYLNAQPIPDGQIQTTSTPVGSANTDAGELLRIGNRAADDRTFEGLLDVTLMWNSALTVEDIAKAHTVFAQRHGQHTGDGGTGVFGDDENGAALYLYGGDYTGTGSAFGGAVVVKGGTTWSDNNSSEGGRVEIRGGNSQDTLAGTGGGGAAGVIIAVGGYGDQDANTHTVGDLTNVSSEFGGVTLTAGNSGNLTLFRGTDNIGTGIPGSTVVRGGDAYDGSGNDTGGRLLLTSGAGRNLSPGGEIIMRSRGPGGTTSSTGDITISTQQSNLGGGLGAQGGVNTDTGDILITTDPPGTSAGIAGDISIIAGSTQAVTGNDPGLVLIEAGDMDSATQSVVGGAGVTVNAGASQGTSSSPGGSVISNAGAQTDNGADASSPGGNIEYYGGNSAKNDPSSGGGQLIASAGDASGVSAPGGAATYSAGSNTNTSGTANGGIFTINGGNVTGASSTGSGGDICLQPGIASGSGADGVVQIKGELVVQSTSAIRAEVVEPADAVASPGDPLTLRAADGDGGGNTGGNLVLGGGAGDGAADGNVTVTRGDIVHSDPVFTDTTRTSSVALTEYLVLLGTVTTGAGKHYRIKAGATSAASSDGGDFIIEVPSGGAGGSDGRVVVNDSGGTEKLNIEVSAANIANVNTPAGASATDQGIDLNINGGAGNTSGRGAHLTLGPGAGGNTTGNSGDIIHSMPPPTGSGAEGRILWQWESLTKMTLSNATSELLEYTLGDAPTATDPGVGVKYSTGDGGATSGAVGDFSIEFGTAASGQPSGNLILSWATFTGSNNTIDYDGTNFEVTYTANDAPTVTSTGSGHRFVTGAGGATSGDAGDFTIGLNTAAGTGADGSFVVENDDGSVSRGIIIVGQNLNSVFGDAPAASGNAGTGYSATGGAGDGVGNGGGFAWLTGTSGVGATGDSGAISLATDDASSTNGSTGDITVETGARTGTGTNGRFIVITKGFSSVGDTSGSVQFRTQSDFTSTSVNKFTSAGQGTVLSGSGTLDLETLGTITTNGRHMKFDVYVTAVEQGTDSNFISARIVQSAYRDAGTVATVTAHQLDEQGNGSTFLTDLAFTLFVSGDDVRLRVTNTGASSYTINYSVSCETQAGGASS